MDRGWIWLFAATESGATILVQICKVGPPAHKSGVQGRSFSPRFLPRYTVGPKPKLLDEFVKPVV